MKNTLFGRLAKLQRRISKFVKKQRDSRRFILTMIAVWTVIPALSANAADLPVSQPSAVTTNVVMSQALQIEQPAFSVDVRQSPRQLAKKQEAIRLASVIALPVIPENIDKRELAKKAAAAWGIDWKILEAVWQVESGKQMTTAVRSYAGAQGPCQFMAGTWRAYAQDGNGDGVKNINDARDCLFGAAKLLAVNGANSGSVDRALLHYNRSLAYVAHVKRIAASIGG